MSSAESKVKRYLTPAKINLRLEVLGKRGDGYHEIKSILCPVGLYDEVAISPTNNGIHLTSNTTRLPLDMNNLAFKAAALLMAKSNLSGGVNLHLEKHIPIAAGLGGGSSDAAAVLKGINELYNLNYSQADLIGLGATIGSDVPFFSLSSPALATGKGEKLAPLTVSPPFWTVLVTPPVAVSTAWAYSQCTIKPRGEAFNFASTINLLTTGKDILRNDLQDVVTHHLPEINETRRILEDLGAWGSSMTGSGPTVFGIFFNEYEAKRVKTQLLKDYRDRGWEISVAKALT